MVVASPARDDLLAYVETDLADHAQDVAFCGWSIGSNDEVRPPQGVEMSGVVGDIESHVKQFANLLGCRRRLHCEKPIKRFGRGQVVCLWTDAADPVHDDRHVFGPAPDTELLEAAQFGYLKVGVGDIAVRVQKDFDFPVSFQARNRADGDSFHHDFPPSSEPARLYL